MKILFYTMSLNKGGAERVISNLSNYLINNNDITIVTNINCKSSYSLDKKINHICIDSNNNKIISKFSKRRTKKLLSIINDINPDLIITFLPEPTIRILSIKNKIDKKVYISIRNHPKHEFPLIFKLIRNHYYKRADKIILQSTSYLNYLPNYLKDKCVVIPNYVSKHFYNIKRDKIENKIVNVGRLEYQKNQKLLIKTFYKFNKINNNYKLYIYGEGKYYNRLNRLIKRKKLSDKVFLMGNSDSINEKIIDSKLFILTSRYEGMPNSLIEAMSLGIPSITTYSTPALKDIIDFKNGIIVNSKKELLSSMINILNNNDLYNEISNNSKKIIDIYNENIVLDKWKNIIGE